MIEKNLAWSGLILKDFVGEMVKEFKAIKCPQKYLPHLVYWLLEMDLKA